MYKIFISHAWSKNDYYDNLISILNKIIGEDNWENCSIPEDKPINLTEYEIEIVNNKIKSLENEYYLLKSRLKDPRLPKVSSRMIIRDGKLIEMETEGTIMDKMTKISEKWYQCQDELKGDRRLSFELASINKFLSASINEYPVLCSALTEQIQKSNIVFVLYFDDVYMKKWINFEVSLAKELNKPTFGIIIPPYIKHRYHVLMCNEMIEFEEKQIAKVLSSNGILIKND